MSLSDVAASPRRAPLVDALGWKHFSWISPITASRWVSWSGAARVIYHKDWYTHSSLLLNDTKALNAFQLNIFNILCFIYKCKKNLNPPVFHNIFTHKTKTKYALRNENSIQEILCQTNFSEYCNSYRGPYLWNKTVISKNVIFSDSYFLQAFKPELKDTLQTYFC